MIAQLNVTLEVPPIKHPDRIEDYALAVGQGALVANLFSLPSATGAVMGFALRLAHKVNETVLNYLFANLQELTLKELTGVRRAADVIAAAVVVSIALPLIMEAAPVHYSTYFAFAVLEHLRPVHALIT